MSYGVSFVNAAGRSVLNDGEYVPYYYTKVYINQAVTIAIPKDSTAPYINTWVPITEKMPLVFTRGYVVAQHLSRSTSVGYWILYHRGGIGTVYIYRWSAPIADSGQYGVHVYNSNGQLAYQSAQKHLRVLDLTPYNGKPYSADIAVATIVHHITNDEYYAYTAVDPNLAAKLGATLNSIIMWNQFNIPFSGSKNSGTNYAPVIDVTGL